MSELTYKSIEKEGIEFYVSTEGEKTGMSIHGLARCSGVARSTLRGVLASVQEGSSTIESLKPFIGKVFVNTEGGGSENNAKIVGSEVCAKLIQYYAYESKNAANEMAKETLGKFAIIGIDNWIKKITGFEKEDTTINKLNQILAILAPQKEEIKELTMKVTKMQPLIEEYKVIKEGVRTSFPGLEKVFEHYTQEDKDLTLVSGNTYTLSEWLESKHVHMSYVDLRKFGRTVAETFKSCTVSSPGKKNVKKKNGKWSCNCTAYGEEHFPILEMALNQFMSN